MKDYKRFKIVDTKTNTVYKKDVEKNILFLLDQNGTVYKKVSKDNVYIMQPVEDHKPLFSLGIEDKNGAEIFVGDIVCEDCKGKEEGTINPYYYVAKFGNETLSYGLVDYNNDFTNIGDYLCGVTPGEISSNFRIVGNIYECDIEQFWEIDRNWKEADCEE